MSYLLTGWVEKPVRDVNVYGNHKSAGFQISSYWAVGGTDGGATVARSCPPVDGLMTRNHLPVATVTSDPQTSPPDCSHPPDLQLRTNIYFNL